MKKVSIFFAVMLSLLFLVCACGEKTPEPSQTTITVEYSANEGGTISGQATQSATVKEGTLAAFNLVTAYANEGYRFVRWSDGRTESWRADMLGQSASYEAIFEKYDTCRFTYLATQGGTVLGETSQNVVLGKEGEVVTAKPDDGYKFVGWSDGVTDRTRCDTAEGELILTARFEKLIYVTATYSAGKGGKINGFDEQTVEAGKETKSVVAVPNDGYRFLGWDDGNKSPERFDIVNSDVTYTAIFSDGVNIEYLVGEGGTVTGELTQKVKWDTSSTPVCAYANEGYRFVGWSDGVLEAERSDMIEVDTSVTAYFKRIYYFTFECDEKYGTLKGELSQECLDGDKTEAVVAEAKDGYNFICWSNGYTNPVLSITAKQDENLRAYFCEASSGLPVISITTENGAKINSKDVYVNCVITINDTERGTHHVLEEAAKIKGRGNSTWTKFDKKPYKFKFDTKQNLFDNGKAKDWVLLADYIDNSLIRNYLAYEIGEEFSTLRATPDCQSVELYLNGEYRGVYLLCEQIEINNHRVEISEDEAVVDTGYLVEMDGWTDTVQVSVPDQLSSSRKYTIKAPDSDVITNEQKEFIKKYLTEALSAARGTDYELVKEYIDVESFAQAYIVYELFKNPDTNYSSVYFYKDAGGKLVCGPLWDFDMSVGNVNHKGNGVFESTKTLWSKDQNPWFNALINNHEEFRALIAEQLLAYDDIIRDTLERRYIEVYQHADAYKKNFEKWDVIGKNTWTNPPYIVKIKTWEEHVEYTRAYLLDSLDYLIEYYCYGE